MLRKSRFVEEPVMCDVPCEFSEVAGVTDDKRGNWLLLRCPNCDVLQEVAISDTERAKLDAIGIPYIWDDIPF